MTPELAISGILLAISFVSFIIAYNKAIKNRIDKHDLQELRQYVDRQDDTLHHRVDKLSETIEDKLDMILRHLLKKNEK